MQYFDLFLAIARKNKNITSVAVRSIKLSSNTIINIFNDFYHFSVYQLFLEYSGRRGSVASSEVCSSGVASSNCYYELSTGTTTGIQLISAAAENLFPLTLVGGGLIIIFYFLFLFFLF